MPKSISDSVIKESLADLLKVDVDDVKAYWNGLIADAHDSAYGEIEGQLLARGYTTDEIATWDRLAEFEKDLSLFWAIVRGGAYENFATNTIQALDRRKELLTVVVAANGVWIQPVGGDRPGVVTTSGPQNFETGQFQYDPDAENMGIDW